MVVCFASAGVFLSAFSCVGLPAAADRFASGLLFLLGVVCVHFILLGLQVPGWPLVSCLLYALIVIGHRPARNAGSAQHLVGHVVCGCLRLRCDPIAGAVGTSSQT